MVPVHSATKGLAAMTLAVAHSHGWLDYEERVCKYWPESAQRGEVHFSPGFMKPSPLWPIGHPGALGSPVRTN
jgi:CubicO group peptidase (beta-lactamase class C family)